MNFEKTDEARPEIFLDKVPQHLMDIILPFSQALYKRYQEGEHLSQVILGVDYSVWMHYWNITQHLTMDVTSETDALLLNYTMRGSIPCMLAGYGKVVLRENKYRLYYVPANIKHAAQFAPGRYLCVHINLHPSHFVSIAEQYPRFHPMLEQARNKIQQGNLQPEADITDYMRTLLDKITHCDLGIAERTLITESAIRELLLLYIRDQNGGGKQHGITGSQELLLEKLENYIITHLDEEISVNRLSREMGVSRSWLQRTVKRKYGRGVHDLVIDKRMNEAARLLLTTKLSVSEILQQVSTMTFSSFSAAFSKRFGITPLDYRKYGGQKRQK